MRNNGFIHFFARKPIRQRRGKASSTADLPAAQPVAASFPEASRLPALDALRGLIIVLMALDHANYFIAQKHASGEYWGGEFPAYRDALSFLTRWVTHLCAPGFFLLMGTGMILFAQSRRRRGWGEWAVIRHFWIRGAVLIALQLLLVNRVWEWSPRNWDTEIYFGVLFALGGCMILGSLLLRLKPPYLLGLTFILLIGTELLVPNPSQWGPPLSLLSSLLVVSGGNTPTFWSNYPILAWLELVTLGMVLGHWLVEDHERTLRRALYLGVAFLLAFALVRGLDSFGNIRPREGNSWIDLLNPVKYPPSISFTLLTTGLNLLLLRLLAWLTEKWPRSLQPLAVFGRAPLFFYVLHLFLYAGLGYWMTPQGSTIPAMYAYWLLGLLILFPLTLWYGLFKQRQPATSIVGFL